MVRPRKIISLARPAAVVQVGNWWAGLSPDEQEERLRGTGPRPRGRPSSDRCDGPKLREYRGKWSQDDFAGKCDVHVSTIQRGEAGARLTDDNYIKIVRTIRELTGLNITVEDLKK